MLNIKSFFSIFLLSILLCGCETIRPFNSAEIHTIKIHEEVAGPKEIIWSTPPSADGFATAMASGVMVAAAGSAIGISPDVTRHSYINNAALRNQSKLSPTQEINKIAITNNIDFKKILKYQFKKQLIVKSFKIIDQGLADAELFISYDALVFEPTKVFNSKEGFATSMTVKLIRNNQIIWQSDDFVSQIDSYGGAYTLEEIRQNPNYLRKQFESSATYLVQHILSKWTHVM